jgi:hypothetical protein
LELQGFLQVQMVESLLEALDVLQIGKKEQETVEEPSSVVVEVMVPCQVLAEKLEVASKVYQMEELPKQEQALPY